MTDTTIPEPRIIAGANIGGDNGHFALVVLSQSSTASGAWFEQLTRRFQQSSDAASLASATREAALVEREQKVEQMIRALREKTDAINSVISHD
jgi:hypothetical protein